MHLPNLLRARLLASLLARIAIGTTWLAAGPAAAKQVINPFGRTAETLRSLEENRARQVEAAKSWSTFHDFTFTDRADESGIRFDHHPVDDAAKNYMAVHYDHGNGIAAADIDGDGRTDVYLVDQLGSSRLFRNLGGGKFEDITESAGVVTTGRIGVAASFADIDNDGRPDLFVTSVRTGNVLFHNLGGGKFEDVTARAGLSVKRAAHSSGAVFFDFDRDGLLDLFVVNVGAYTRNEKGRGGFFLGRVDAFNGWQFPARGEQSVLYRNLGGGRFEDVSSRMGLEHRGWSGDATFCDLDLDGYPELYVASMSGADKYYSSDHGQRFVDKTASVFPRTPWGSMGLKFFDRDLDGLMDLFVTDMHSDMTAGQIKAGDQDFSPKFDKQKSDVWCSAEWNAATRLGASNNILGNAFFQNLGQGRFVEVSGSIGAETYWPWGISVADLNSDGYEDVFVTAGMGYPMRYAINSVLLNDGGKRFVDAEYIVGVEPRKGGRIEKEFFTLDASGADKAHALSKGKTGLVSVTGTLSSRSSVAFDLDGDGDLDLVTNEWNDRPQVLVSDLSAKRAVRHLSIRLVGTVSNRDGLGATVKVRCGAKTYTRFHDGKSGYLSQSSLPLYFGLADASQADAVEVIWPSGRRQSVAAPVKAGTSLTITEDR